MTLRSRTFRAGGLIPSCRKPTKRTAKVSERRRGGQVMRQRHGDLFGVFSRAMHFPAGRRIGRLLEQAHTPTTTRRPIVYRSRRLDGSRERLFAFPMARPR